MGGRRFQLSRNSLRVELQTDPCSHYLTDRGGSLSVVAGRSLLSVAVIARSIDHRLFKDVSDTEGGRERTEKEGGTEGGREGGL